MIAFFLSPIYLLVCWYLLRWILRWMKACHGVFHKKKVQIGLVIGYAFVALSLLTSFLLPVSPLQRVLKCISNVWLGVLVYLIMTVGIAGFLRLVLKRTNFARKEHLFNQKHFILTGWLCLVIVVSLSVSGVVGARNLQTTDYQVTVHKAVEGRESLRVVLVADLHLGYSIGQWHMNNMVEKINALSPDLVVIAGDIFDNEYDALDDPAKLAATLRTIQSTYGVYACYGNHDLQEKILAGFTFHQDAAKASDPRMDVFLADANIHLLQDEGVLIDDSFYLYGRADYERPGRGIQQRQTPEDITRDMDQSKPILVLDHEPRELQELADAGVDLDLCGHTHDGQMFPGNLTIHLFWENPCGYLQKGRMHNIVTSGLGVIGPNMRVGTKSEICCIDVNFDGAE